MGAFELGCAIAAIENAWEAENGRWHPAGVNQDIAIPEDLHELAQDVTDRSSAMAFLQGYFGRREGMEVFENGLNVVCHSRLADKLVEASADLVGARVGWQHADAIDGTHQTVRMVFWNDLTLVCAIARCGRSHPLRRLTAAIPLL